MKRLSIIMILLLLVVAGQAQTYYNLRYSWEQIEDAITAVRDTFPGLISSKLDADISHLELPANPGIPTLINFSIHDAPLDSAHGYIFAADSMSVIRIQAHTSDGLSADSWSVTVGPSEPDPDYTLTVAGAAIASRWDVAGADFAEYFEAGEELGLGIAVVFDEQGLVRAAKDGEKPFGIVSAGAGFIGNSGRPALPVLTTALGDTIYREVQYVKVTREARFPSMSSITSWIPAAKLKEIPKDAETVIRREAVSNPDFGKAYIPHRKNDKMILVGLVGQLPLKKGQPTHPNWFRIKALDAGTELWLIK